MNDTSLGNSYSDHGCAVAGIANVVSTNSLRFFSGTSSGPHMAKKSIQRSLSAEPVDLILNGLIGYGFRSATKSPVAELIQWANGTEAPILALDVPSGLDSTTGHRPGDSTQPRWTMTLAPSKTGLLPEHTGQLFLADIGIPLQTYRRLSLSYVNPFAKGFWVSLICRS